LTRPFGIDFELTLRTTATFIRFLARIVCIWSLPADASQSSLSFFSDSLALEIPATLLASSQEMPPKSKEKWVGDAHARSEIDPLVERELLKEYSGTEIRMSETENDVVLEGPNNERIVATIDVQYPAIDVKRLRTLIDVVRHRNAKLKTNTQRILVVVTESSVFSVVEKAIEGLALDQQVRILLLGFDVMKAVGRRFWFDTAHLKRWVAA
jgi:hypothetical protein